MEKNGVYERYRADTNALADVGRELRRQVSAMMVTLPRDLAETAAAAWDHDEDADAEESWDGDESWVSTASGITAVTSR
jgi:hypothetical protein